MDYQVETVANDTTFIDLSKSQIKELHDKIFGETISSPKAMGMVVKLELTYIPFLLFIIVMVTAINSRWNRNYKRIVEAYEKTDKTEEQTKNLGMLKGQRLNIWDRFFVYFVTWGSSLYIDTMLMASGIFQFPWLSIPVIISVIYKKMKRLAETSSLQGVDDSDIVERFNSIVEKMMVEPLIESIGKRIKNFFNSI